MKELRLVMAGRRYVGMGLGALILALLALAWAKGGEQDMREISVPVALPATGELAGQGA